MKNRGGLRQNAGWPRIAALMLAALAACPMTGCQMKGPDPAVMDSLAEMEIRIRLLQSEVTDVRQALQARDAREQGDTSPEDRLAARLDLLQQRIDDLPGNLADICPEPTPTATVTTQCDSAPQIQRVVVSGDKLVVGQEERVWVEALSGFLLAAIDAGREQSLIQAGEMMEFERDGNRWVRFGIPGGEEPATIERPVKRTTRVDDERRPVVDLRVQLGDVRENVEFAVMVTSEADYPIVLGRNFLTDVALVDVARKRVQPARPSGG